MINLRPATLEDAKLLFEMKNDIVMRRFSIETHDEIEWNDHIRWLNDNLEYTEIIELDGVACGDIRIRYGEVAIKIHKDYRGKGISTEVLMSIVEKHDSLKARIVDGNIPSMRLFLKCGFKIIDHKDRYYILKYEV